MRFFLFLILIFLISCTGFQQRDDNRALARVYNEYLFESDLDGLIPANANTRDSLLITENYINNWIRQHLIIHKAEQNLTTEEADFSRQLEEYEHSLIIYAYESKLIRQNLHTDVGNNDIEDYYYENSENFKLTENILKLHYIKLHIDSPEVLNFKRLIRYDNIDSLYLLEDYCKLYATDYWLEEEWILLSDIWNKMPATTQKQEDFLEGNKNIQVLEDPYWYLARINDYRLENNISPIAFEKDNIKSIIINNRKLDLIQNMRKDLLKLALENNDVEVYQ